MEVTKTFPQVLRWAARSIGGLILAFVLLHLVSEGLPNVDKVAPTEWFLWSGFALSLVGYAMLWKWELTGGVVALGGIVLFYVANFVLSGKLPGGWVLPLFFLPGCLSIICWVTGHRSSPSQR